MPLLRHENNFMEKEKRDIRHESNPPKLPKTQDVSICLVNPQNENAPIYTLRVSNSEKSFAE